MPSAGCWLLAGLNLDTTCVPGACLARGVPGWILLPIILLVIPTSIEGDRPYR